jgi:hypothetical protein
MHQDTWFRATEYIIINQVHTALPIVASGVLLFLLKFTSQNAFVIILLLDNSSSAMLVFMDADCKSLSTYKSISWFLIAGILLLAFLPAHYHLHHLYNDENLDLAATKHAHIIDLHILTESAEQSHHDEEATIIALSPDGIVKKSNADFSPFIMLAIVLLLLPALNKRINIPLSYRNTTPKQSYPHFTPLLRAPPLY